MRKRLYLKLMKGTKDSIVINGPLKWLTRTVLVFGLIAFQGHVSEFRLHNSEPTKTELNDHRRISFKRTVNYQKTFQDLSGSLLTSRTELFASLLLHQENKIAVKLRSILEEQPTNEQAGFLIHYSTDRSEEFCTSHLKG